MPCCVWSASPSHPAGAIRPAPGSTRKASRALDDVPRDCNRWKCGKLVRDSGPCGRNGPLGGVKRDFPNGPGDSGSAAQLPWALPPWRPPPPTPHKPTSSEHRLNMFKESDCAGNLGRCPPSPVKIQRAPDPTKCPNKSRPISRAMFPDVLHTGTSCPTFLRSRSVE